MNPAPVAVAVRQSGFEGRRRLPGFWDTFLGRRLAAVTPAACWRSAWFLPVFLSAATLAYLLVIIVMATLGQDDGGPRRRPLFGEDGPPETSSRRPSEEEAPHPSSLDFAAWYPQAADAPALPPAPEPVPPPAASEDERRPEWALSEPPSPPQPRSYPRKPLLAPRTFAVPAASQAKTAAFVSASPAKESVRPAAGGPAPAVPNVVGRKSVREFRDMVGMSHAR